MIVLLVGCLAPNPVTLAAEPPTLMSPQERYTSWLATKAPGATGEESAALAMGGFQFFSVKTERGKRHEAAVSPLTLVTKDGSGDWATFLRAGTPDQVARAVAWLHGTASLLTPGSPTVSSLDAKKPGVAARVTAPAVTGAGTQATLDAWYLFQPGSQVSHLVIEGRPDGGTWSWTPLTP
ncbi:MAG: hypothetical protein Q8P41_13900 [Pseudomonadota bacterium]|nr:hypothetical protein [Pseudomonadota bacterium]